MSTTNIEQDQPNQKVNLPEVITVKGETVSLASIPELANYQNSLRAAIQQQEKNKLFTVINDLKNQINVMQNKAPEPAVVPADVLANALTAFSEQMKAEMKQHFDQTLEVLNKRLNPVAEQSEFLRRQNLETYRAKLLTENQNSCIPELVKGDSIEALDASLKESKEIYKTHFAALAPTQSLATTPVAPATQANTNSPAPAASTAPVQGNVAQPTAQATPSAPSTATPEPPAPQAPIPPASVLNVPADPFASIKNMGMDEWEKQRSAVKQKLRELEGVQ